MANNREKPEKMTWRKKERETIKMEVAEELGLVGKIKREGWQNLTARETGKIGGRMSKLLRKDEKKAGEEPPKTR